jgi:hypothetical protein
MTFGDGHGIYQHIGNIGQSDADKLVKAVAAKPRSDNLSKISASTARMLSLPPRSIAAWGRAGTMSAHRAPYHGRGRGQYAPPANRSYRPLPGPRQRQRDSGRRDPARPRRSHDAGQGSLRRRIGLAAWKLARSLGLSTPKSWVRFQTVEAYYSIAVRDLEREIAPLLEAEKMGLLVWSPLAGGLMSGKFTRDDQKPSDSRRSAFDFPIVDKSLEHRRCHGADCQGPFLQLCEGCPGLPVVTSVIMGANRIDQLEDNLAAVDLELSDDDIRKLDQVSALPPEYPGWMSATQGADRLGPTDLWAEAVASAS